MEDNVYKLAKTEHNTKVKEFSTMIGGDVVITRADGNKNGQYFPDVRKNGFGYELQMMPRGPLLKKAEKWTVDEKHILVVIIPESVVEVFDGIGFYHNGCFVKM